MLEVTIDYWESQKLFEQDENLYNELMEKDASSFIRKQDTRWEKDEAGKSVNKGFGSFNFYINDLSSINPRLIKFCKFEPLNGLEMMGGARINTENVFEAAKRNQIMLPNNLLLEMRVLCVETNACTDHVNSILKEGWKLIAVLPQHNQARPDYIFGRT